MMVAKKSFQKKLYLSCFTLNLVLLLICCSVFYYHTINSLKRNMQDTLTSNTTLLWDKLEILLSTSNNSLKELQTNTTLSDLTKSIHPSEQNYFAIHIPERTAFEQAFRSVLISQNLNGSISYVSNYCDNVGLDSYNGTHEYLQKEKLSSNEAIVDLLKNNFYVTYLPPHQDYWGNYKTVFSIVRSMRNTYNKYGVLIMDLDISFLTELLNNFESPSDYSITLLDEKGKFAYTTNEQLNIELFMSSYESSKNQESNQQFSHDRLSLSCYIYSSTTGWTFILTSSTEGYLDSLKQTLLISVLLFLSLFIIMSSFLFMLTYTLTKPLKQLCTQLQQLEPGKNIKLKRITSDNEIITLTNAVQAFLSEIYEQNQQLTEMRRRNMQAHYDAMEAQLNPHFLYNTLSVIGMTGLSNNDNTTFTMCNELAGLLRYSLSYTGQSVLLEQEIANTLSYLYIMKMRYEDDLIYEWNLDDSINTISVPKLILQPLVENCFQHGFQQTEHELIPPWKIRISSFRDDSFWYLSISNNGAPFKMEKLQHLYSTLSQFKLTDAFVRGEEDLFHRQGFGLENTILRLHIYYQGKSYFHVDHLDSEETTVTIGGPLNPQTIFCRQ